MKAKTILFISIFALAATSLAQAHAFLDHAQPRVGSTVSEPPPRVKIWFTEELEGAFSKIKVYDAGKQEIDKKDVKVDPSDKAVMTVSLPKLGPGIYKVEWSAVAVDTHHTTGTYTFEVKAP